MISKSKIRKKNLAVLMTVFIGVFISTLCLEAQVPDENLGLRADWMRGSYGLNWKPGRTENGKSERFSLNIKPLLEQIEGLRAVDYIQLHLSESSVYSPTHLAPHDLIESLWEGDMSNGSPINLVVPRAATNRDPFLELIHDVRAAGLKVQVYVNSSNMLNRVGEENPNEFPDITARWKNWCDTNAEAQTFINSQSYHTDPDWPNRKYMFCYAEFILKEYAIRYGDLVDSWIFDSGRYMWQYNGDNQDSNEVDDQRVYQAFADAAHHGNPNASIAFNNSPGSQTAPENPFSPATLFDDYMFGHPFNGGSNFGDNPNNLRLVEWIEERNGYVQTADPAESRTWDDFVVGHIDPPMSTGAWNAGANPAQTNEAFVDWYSRVLLNGGAMTPGIPLLDRYGWSSLAMLNYAIEQLTLLDDYLKVNQSPGTPNWARQATILPPAYVGQAYSHELVNGYDFWDPEDDTITALEALGSFPLWLSITETMPGVWTLSGTPDETMDTDYEFNLQVSDASGGTERTVNLKVLENYSPEPIISDVEVIATDNTNYGIDNTATMFSDIQTAPDGLATYRISVAVSPPSGNAIISGISGGGASAKSWGIGDGTDSNQDYIFRGSDNEWVESIADIQIIDFNANGGNLSSEYITTNFKGITIINAQSSNDFVSIEVETITANLGSLTNPTETIDLREATYVDSITQFRIGTGNTSDTNKWSVENMMVAVSFYGNDLNITSNQNLSFAEDKPFRVFPNPAKNEVSLNIPIYAGKLIDVSGRTVKEYSDNSTSLDISKITPGLYFLSGRSKEGNVLSHKIIKK